MFVRPTVATLAAVGAGILASAPAAASPIVIQEVLYDPAGPDAPGAFTELFGPPGMNLDGWTLVGVNGSSGTPYRSIDLSASIIPLDGIFVIAAASAGAALAAVRDLIGNVDWQNGPDAVQLWDPLGAIVDALQYGDAGGGNAGEGRPAPDPASGLSLSRNRLGADTGDNATDFLVGEPTPGWMRSAEASIPSRRASCSWCSVSS